MYWSCFNSIQPKTRFQYPRAGTILLQLPNYSALFLITEKVSENFLFTVQPFHSASNNHELAPFRGFPPRNSKRGPASLHNSAHYPKANPVSCSGKCRLRLTDGRVATGPHPLEAGAGPRASHHTDACRVINPAEADPQKPKSTAGLSGDDVGCARHRFYGAPPNFLFLLDTFDVHFFFF